MRVVELGSIEWIFKDSRFLILILRIFTFGSLCFKPHRCRWPDKLSVVGTVPGLMEAKGAGREAYSDGFREMSFAISVWEVPMKRLTAAR